MSSQVSKMFLSILRYFENAFFWIILLHSFISTSFSLFFHVTKDPRLRLHYSSTAYLQRGKTLPNKDWLSRLRLQNTSTASLQWSKTPPKCPGNDTKQSDGEVPVMVTLWGMQSNPSLPSLPGPLWPGVVAPDRVLSTGQIELNCLLMQNCLKKNCFDM